MLTGLEQYSLERAGYFIRRAAISDDVLVAGEIVRILEAVLPTMRSALSGPLRYYRGTVVGQVWSRGFPIPWDVPVGEQLSALARTAEHLQARIDTAADESLVLLPGTHAAAPSPEDAAALAANRDPPGMVRVRLCPGDALFWNTNVIHRNTRDMQGGICVTCVSQNIHAPPCAWMGEPLEMPSKEIA